MSTSALVRVFAGILVCGCGAPPTPRAVETAPAKATETTRVDASGPASVPAPASAPTSGDTVDAGDFAVRERVDPRPDTIVLEQPGAEPRTRLVAAGRVGDVRMLELHLTMSVAIQVASRAVPDTAVPTLRVGLRAETTAVDDGVTLAIAVTSVEADEPVGTTPRVHDAITRTAERMRSTRGTLRLGADGQWTAAELDGTTTSTHGAAALEPEAGGLVAALQELLPAVPVDQDVGDGATWTTIRHVRRDAVRLEQSGAWRLERRATGHDHASVLILDSEHVATTDAAATPGVVQASSGTTHAELELGAGVLPRRATATVETRTRADLELLGAAQVASMRTTLTLVLQDAPTAPSR